MSSFHVDALVKCWFGVVGAVIGSFLNVVIYRLPIGFRLGLPSRSACRTCKRRLEWSENIPVVSYIAQRGKCRGCGSSISPRYPLVEAMSSALFVAVHGYYGTAFPAFYYCAFVAALLAITFIDIDHRIIPDVISLPGVAVGFIFSSWIPELGPLNSALGAATGGGALWLTALAYEKASGREGLGFGDVKLLAMIGAFLGPKGALATVLTSSLVGSLIGLTVMLARKENLKLALPYGPFLAIGALVFLFWKEQLSLIVY